MFLPLPSHLPKQKAFFLFNNFFIFFLRLKKLKVATTIKRGKRKEKENEKSVQLILTHQLFGELIKGYIYTIELFAQKKN